MGKRATFHSAWLPYALIAPQIIVMQKWFVKGLVETGK